MTVSSTTAPRRRKVQATRIGKVISNKMDKSAVVAVERRFAHPIYRKLVRKTTRYIVHDERNEAQIGDKVRIVEGRPLSRRKRWRLQQVLERSALAGTTAADIDAPEIARGGKGSAVTKDSPGEGR